MILIRANTERQIPVIRATLVSAPLSSASKYVYTFYLDSATGVFTYRTKGAMATPGRCKSSMVGIDSPLVGKGFEGSSK